MEARSGYQKISSYLMTLLFLFAGAVQYDDPDAILWMGIYGGAAALTVLTLLDKVNWPVLAITATISLAATAAVGISALNEGAITSAFNTWQMHSTGQEKAREAGGLLVVTVWMTALTLRVRKRNSQAGRSEQRGQ